MRAAVLCLVCAFLVLRQAPLANAQLLGIGLMPCEEFLQLSIDEDIDDVIAVGNWVEGYVSGINAAEMIAERGAFDTQSMGQDMFFIETIQLACRDFPGDRVAAVMTRLIFNFPRVQPQ